MGRLAQVHSTVQLLRLPLPRQRRRRAVRHGIGGQGQIVRARGATPIWNWRGWNPAESGVAIGSRAGRALRNFRRPCPNVPGVLDIVQGGAVLVGKDIADAMRLQALPPSIAQELFARLKSMIRLRSRIAVSGSAARYSIAEVGELVRPAGLEVHNPANLRHLRGCRDQTQRPAGPPRLLPSPEFARLFRMPHRLDPMPPSDRVDWPAVSGQTFFNGVCFLTRAQSTGIL